MRKLIFLMLALVLLVSFATMGVGCKGKEAEKPVVKEEPKPPEAPAPAAPAATPAPAPEKPAEAPKK